MKKLLIILLLILVASSLFAGTYKAQVSMSSTAEVTEPLLAKLGYQLQPIELTEEEEATLPTFTLYNRFPIPAWVTISVVNQPGSFTIILPSPQPINIVPVNPPYHLGDDISITYEATTAGDYTVTYLVMADIISSGSRARVELTIDVPVTVKPKPPPTLPPSP